MSVSASGHHLAMGFERLVPNSQSVLLLDLCHYLRLCWCQYLYLRQTRKSDGQEEENEKRTCDIFTIICTVHLTGQITLYTTDAGATPNSRHDTPLHHDFTPTFDCWQLHRRRCESRKGQEVDEKTTPRRFDQLGRRYGQIPAGQ